MRGSEDTEPEVPGGTLEAGDSPDSDHSEGGGGLWVFGYGSLLWDPGFPHEEVYAAVVYGWHRRYSLLSRQSWGSAERPGLSAALHAGGSVAGRVFRVAPGHVDETLAYLQVRENAYRHIEVTAWLAGKRRVTARSFAFDHVNGRFAPELAVEERCALIRQGAGTKGRSLHYLKGVVATLAEDGRTCRHSRHLLARIDSGSAGG